MPHGHFVWCDLSAYNAPQSRAFYERLMGWSFTQDGDYHIAHQGRTPIAGHFPMPAKFQDMGMPPFWMSYIAVEDIDKTVARAGDLGGRVEIPPSDFATGGKYALIRDPLGAGFTVYQGLPLGGGSQRAHGLFISDVTAVIPFYSGLFGWEFRQNNHTYEIFKDNNYVGDCHEFQDDIRGKKHYWMVYFSHGDLGKAQKITMQNGGKVDASFDLTDGPAMMIRDPDGAALVLVSPQKHPTISRTVVVFYEILSLLTNEWFWISLIALIAFIGGYYALYQ